MKDKRFGDKAHAKIIFFHSNAEFYVFSKTRKLKTSRHLKYFFTFSHVKAPRLEVSGRASADSSCRKERRHGVRHCLLNRTEVRASLIGAAPRIEWFFAE